MSDFNNDIDWDADNNEGSEVAPPPGAGFPSPPPVVSANPVYDNQVEAVDINAVDPSSTILSVDADGESEHVTVVQVDANGNEVYTRIDMALPPLDESEAREITEKIKGTTNLLYLLIKRAHAGKAYKALGYSSFEAYVREEFNYSRSYAYKLLNQANVIEAIESVVPDGTEVYVGELTARGLKGSLPELLEDIEERTVEASPQEAQRLIEEAIRDHQNRNNEVDEAYEDFDDFNPADGGAEGNDFSSPYAGGDLGEFIDNDDDEIDEFLTEDPTLLIKRLEGLWSLINGLQAFNDLSESADLKELLPLIQEDRFEEVTRLIAVNREWLETLNVAWDDYKENYSVSDNSDDETSDDSEEFNEEEFGDIKFD